MAKRGKKKNGGETLKKMSGEFVKSKIKHWPGKRRAGWIRYPVPKGTDWDQRMVRGGSM